jgi:hypothetical protein
MYALDTRNPGTLNFGSLYNYLITEQMIRFLNGSWLNILKPQCNKKYYGLLLLCYLVLGFDFWVELFSSEMFLSSWIWKALGIIHWPVVHWSMHLVNEESMCNDDILLFSFFKQNPKTPGTVLAIYFGYIFEIFWTEEMLTLFWRFV